MIFPVVAPAGTSATMLVALQFVGVAAIPLNLTVLVPCVAPKLAPVIVTEVPASPDVGFRLVMLGAAAAEIVKFTPLLARPPTVTVTFPVVAPAGTGTTMLVALQFVGVAGVPLNLTVLLPCVAPKFAPVIVTEAPATPDVGFRFAMLATESVEFPCPRPEQLAFSSAKTKVINSRTTLAPRDRRPRLEPRNPIVTTPPPDNAIAMAPKDTVTATVKTKLRPSLG
jgi:hypothetical protein